MDGAGDWICGVVCGGVWKRGVVYGVCAAERIWAVRDLPDYCGDIGVVFCGEIVGVGESTAISLQSTVRSVELVARRREQAAIPPLQIRNDRGDMGRSVLRPYFLETAAGRGLRWERELV